MLVTNFSKASGQGLSRLHRLLLGNVVYSINTEMMKVIVNPVSISSQNVTSLKITKHFVPHKQDSAK